MEAQSRKSSFTGKTSLLSCRWVCGSAARMRGSHRYGSRLRPRDLLMIYARLTHVLAHEVSRAVFVATSGMCRCVTSPFTTESSQRQGYGGSSGFRSPLGERRRERQQRRQRDRTILVTPQAQQAQPSSRALVNKQLSSSTSQQYITDALPRHVHARHWAASVV